MVRNESGWSSFAEREVKCNVDWLLRIVYEVSLVSDIGRACLMEVGYRIQSIQRTFIRQHKHVDKHLNKLENITVHEY